MRITIKGNLLTALLLVLAIALSFVPFIRAVEPPGILLDAVHCRDDSKIGLQKENYESHHISGTSEAQTSKRQRAKAESEDQTGGPVRKIAALLGESPVFLLTS